MRRYIFLLLPLLLLFLVPTKTHASHIVGTDMRYECLGSNIYRVHVYWYEFCSGASSLQMMSGTTPGFSTSFFTADNTPFSWAWCPDVTPTGCNNPNGCPFPTPVGNWVFVEEEYGETTPLCGTAQSTCTSSSSGNEGVRRGHYYRDFDMSSVGTCTSWTFGIEQGTRNAGIDNIQGSSNSQNMYNDITLDLTLSPCNNSPDFLNPASPFFCVGESYNLNQGAVDIDGDSLAYRFVPCRSGAINDGTVPSAITSFNNIQLAAGFTPTNFMPTASGITLNPATGDISLTPNQVGQYAVCVAVDEYRDSTLISTTTRDIQTFVIACDNTIPDPGSTIPPNADPTAITDTIFEFVTCSETDSINFDIILYDPDSTQLTVDYDFIDFTNANVTVEYDPANPTITIVKFRRAALPPRFAPYGLLITASDGACPIEGVNQKTYQIYNRGGSLSLNTFASVNCNEATFSAPVFGGTGGDPDYAWSGEGGLTGDTAEFTYAYPDTGTYNYNVEVTDAFGCVSKDSGQVFIASAGVDADVAFSQDTVCQFDTLTAQYVGVDPDATIEWNFGQGATPVTRTGVGPHDVLYTNSGPKTVTLSLFKNGCSREVTYPIYVSPRPLINAGSDIAFCENDSGVFLDAQINLQDTGQCTYSWSPAFGLDDPNSQLTYARPTVSRDYELIVNCLGCNSDVDAVSVEVNSAPTAFFDRPEYYACEFAQGAQVNTTTIGGTGNVSYNWTPQTNVSTPNGPNPTISPTAPTEYALTITDQNGCSDTNRVDVTPIENPRANAQVLGGSIDKCKSGGAVQLQGGVNDDPLAPTGSYTYQWSPAIGLSNPNVQSPYADPDVGTSYSLIVTNDVTGCSSSVYALDSLASINVVVVTPPTPNAGPDVSICKGDSVQIGLDVNVGPVPQPDVDYFWTQSTGLSSDTIARPWASPTQTRIYFLKIRKGNCWAEAADTVTVKVNQRPTVNGPQFYEICDGDSIQLDANAFFFGGVPGNFSYRWTPATGLSDSTVLNPIASPGTTQNYQFFAAYKGCESLTPLDVQMSVKPRAQIEADPTPGDDGILFCPDNGPVQLNPTINVPAGWADSLYVSWSPSVGLSDPSVANPTASPNQSTVYTLYAAINGASGCEAIDSVEVFVGPELDVRLTPDVATICTGQDINLSATAGVGSASYEWVPQSAFISSTGPNVTAQPATDGPLSVIASEGGCSDTATADVFVLPAPEARFTYSYARGCVGMIVQFTNTSTNVGNGSANRIWDFGDGSPVSNALNPTHTYAAPGIYTVTLTVYAPGGCLLSDTMTTQVVVGGALAADFTSDPLPATAMTLPNADVTFSPVDTTAQSYFWLFGDGQSSSAMNPTHTYQVPGNFTVTLNLTDSAGCSYTKTKGLYVVEEEMITDMTTVFTPNGDGINDTWTLGYTGDKPVEINIFNRQGQLVFSSTNRNAAWTGMTNDGKALATGVYMYVVSIGDRKFDGNITLLR